MLIAALCAAPLRPASAYEFEVKARTTGQARSLVSLGLGRNPSRLNTRRISQSLQLSLWDLGGDLGSLKTHVSRWKAGERGRPNIYFSSFLLMDHEQGSFGTGSLLLGGRFRDALDVIPELERTSLQLDLLYGYLAVEGLWRGSLDVYLGRQMDVAGLEWLSMDGVKVRAHLSLPVTAEIFAGLRVRENSWGGRDVLALDGSSGALCEEFVEQGGASGAGGGQWRPIEGLARGRRSPFTSDDEPCPQRDERMPIWGAAIATSGLSHFSARLSYRRSQSASPGILPPSDRYEGEDLGYYPRASAGAGTGVNEERFALSMRGRWRRHGVSFTPYSAARYSLLHGIFDEAHLGLRTQKGSLVLESELFYSQPTFDGDSIYNVFSSEPYADARLTWRYEPPRSHAWRGYLRAWGRRYTSEDTPEATGASEAYAAGGRGGVGYRRGRLRSRVDSFAEGGVGGRRLGTIWAGQWRMNQDLSLRSRVSVIRFADESRRSLRGTNFGLQIGTRYLLIHGIAADFLLEANSSALERFALAAYLMIDLAFVPDL